MNTKFTIYGTPNCGFCTAAKNLLEQKFEVEYIDMVQAGISRDDLTKIIGQPVRSVPQIIKGEEYIGGYTELVAYLKHNPINS